MKTYQEVLDWLYVQVPNYQREGKSAYKPGFENIIALCNLLDNPQNRFKSVHIAGTNGKGSVSNMVASVLKDSGYKTGLYNSPHIINFTERIKINGKECTEQFIFEFITKIQHKIKRIHPSFFELTTAIAFQYFAENNVDIAIIEVGLGGRLDSTNIITPEVCAITSISFDHQDLLGDTLEKIALEKAGIIKKNIPIIIGEENSNIKNLLIETAKTKKAPYIDATIIKHEYKTDLEGIYQEKNLKTALGIIQVLIEKGFNLPKEKIEEGLLHVQENNNFKGRWQIIQKEKPIIICDTGHNEDGFKYISKQLSFLLSEPKYKYLHIVMGFVKGKDVGKILSILPREAIYYFVKPSNERGLFPGEYEDQIKKYIKTYKIFNFVKEGLSEAKNNADQDDIIFIGGSNFVVAEIL